MTETIKRSPEETSVFHERMSRAGHQIIDQALWNELMHFYIAEAWMLDDRRMRDWVNLFTDDVSYYMPRRKNIGFRDLHREIPERGTDLALIDDDRDMLEVRVQRIESGMAWAENPPSRTRHLIGNLMIVSVEGDEVAVRTGFVCNRSHSEHDQALYSGSRDDVLRRVNGSWMIARRTIILDANVIQDKNLAIFF